MFFDLLVIGPDNFLGGHTTIRAASRVVNQQHALT